MRGIDEAGLADEVLRALDELVAALRVPFPLSDFVLYGSHARGSADEESDIDLLVLTARPLSREERHVITDAAFGVNLRHGTNFSTLVVDREAWEHGRFQSLPIRREIQREGIAL